jgi:Protein of unknown function (DUF1761)
MHNLIVYAVTALIPMILGMIWYNPKVFGTAWMPAAGLTPESAQAGFNMPLVFGLAYVMSFFLAIALGFTVVHQAALISVTRPEPGTPMMPAVDQWLHQGWLLIGHSYRRYRHGAFHGTIFAIFGLLPVITVNSLFERRGFKYIAITFGFWLINCILMGAILCHWLVVEIPA